MGAVKFSVDITWQPSSTPSILIPLFLHKCLPSRFSHVRLFLTLWIIARQAPLSLGFSTQEYWSGMLCSPLGNLPNPGIESTSLKSPALAGGFFATSTTWEALLLRQPGKLLFHRQTLFLICCVFPVCF